MINKKIKKNKGFHFIKSYSTCLKRSPKYSRGFTLVETMFAVYILTFTITGLMTVVANSLFAARYAKDEITVNYLLQEAIDYVRNDRDTTVFLASGPSTTAQNWATFWDKYSNCLDPNGCSFDVLPNLLSTNGGTKTQCPNGVCPFLIYNPNADPSVDNNSFYFNYDNNILLPGMLKTNFQRKIVVVKNLTNPDEIDVIVTVSWKNGGMNKTRSLTTSLMKWQQ